MVLIVDHRQTQPCAGHTCSLRERILQAASHECALLTEMQTSGVSVQLKVLLHSAA